MSSLISKRLATTFRMTYFEANNPVMQRAFLKTLKIEVSSPAQHFSYNNCVHACTVRTNLMSEYVQIIEYVL